MKKIYTINDYEVIWTIKKGLDMGYENSQQSLTVLDDNNIFCTVVECGNNRYNIYLLDYDGLSIYQGNRQELYGFVKGELQELDDNFKDEECCELLVLQDFLTKVNKPKYPFGKETSILLH